MENTGASEARRKRDTRSGNYDARTLGARTLAVVIALLATLATLQLVSQTTPAVTTDSRPLLQTVVTGTQTSGNCGTMWTDVQNSDNVYCKYQESTTTRLLPNANGDTGFWIVSGTGDCTQESNEWECVNDNPNDGDGTYVKSTSSSVTDSLENLETVGFNGATVSSVVVTVWCRKTVSQTVGVRTLIKTNSVLFPGASNFNCPNSGTYGSTSTTYTKNPQTNAVWQQPEIDALQAGCRDNDGTTREVRCSEVRVDVNFNNRQSLEVRFAFSGVPTAGDRWALVAECKFLVEGGGGENVLVQVGQGGNPPSSWITAYTCASSSDTLFTTYALSTAELNNGAPVIRLWDNPGATDTVQGTMDLDVLRIDRTAAPPTQVGTDIRFWDDFEGGTKKWLPFVDPATNRFGPIPGDDRTGQVRQSWFFGNRNVLSMASRSSSPGIAYGLTALFSQTPAYIVLMNFSVSDAVLPGDPELPGAFTVYDDGYTRLRIEGIGPFADPGGRLVVYTSLVPPVPTFIQVLRFNVWYLLDIRVYPADGLFQLFINETYKGGFGLASSAARGMALLGDDSYAAGTSGVAAWDNVVVATLRTPPYSENFDDGSIADWIREYTPFNTFAVSTENGPPSLPYDLKAREASGGTAYGFSPYIDLDAPLAALPDYKINFRFFVPTGATPQGLIVVSDGASHVRAENRDSSSFDLKAYVSPIDTRQVAQVSKGAWHALIVEVHRIAAPTPNYDVWIDGTRAPTGPFPFVADQHYRKAPSDLVLGDHTASGTGGEAFWDDVSVTFGTIGPPTLTICDGGVSPSIGSRVTQTFTYCVIYQDPSNNPPKGGAPLVLLANTDARLKKVIPTTDVPMTFDSWIGADDDYVDGAKYKHSRTWFYPSTFYTYKFHANDGLGNYVETLTFPGPEVTGCDPPMLYDDFVSPERGLTGKTLFTWRVTLRDLDGTTYSGNPSDPTHVTVVRDGPARILSRSDPGGGDTTHGQAWSRAETLSAAGVHDFKFRAVDASCPDSTVETTLVYLPIVFDPETSPCNDEWVTFHHDMARTGVSECTAPLSQYNQVAWRGRANGLPSDSSPAIADRTTDLLFIGRNDALMSYEAQSGTPRWSAPSLGTFTQSPTLAGGMVIIGDQYGVVRAYSEQGVLRWPHYANQYNPSCPEGPKITGSVAVANNLVYVSVGDRGIFLALDLQTGTLVWRFDLPDCGDFTTSPAVAYDKVFVAATTQNEAKLYALPAMDPDADGQVLDNANPALSELVWTFTLPEPDVTRRLIQSTPAVNAGGVFFGADDGQVWGLPINDPNQDKIMRVTQPGEEWLWRPFETWTALGATQRGPNDKVRSSPAVHDRLDVFPPQKALFVGARRSLIALDRETGGPDPIWTYVIPLDGNDFPVTSSPAVAAGSGTVYFRHWEGLNGNLYAFLEVEFNPPDGTGDLLWQRPVTTSGSLSSPAVFDGLLFTGTYPFSGDFHVWAIKDP